MPTFLNTGSFLANSWRQGYIPFAKRDHVYVGTWDDISTFATDLSQQADNLTAGAGYWSETGPSIRNISWPRTLDFACLHSGTDTGFVLAHGITSEASSSYSIQLNNTTAQFRQNNVIIMSCTIPGANSTPQPIYGIWNSRIHPTSGTGADKVLHEGLIYNANSGTFNGCFATTAITAFSSSNNSLFIVGNNATVNRGHPFMMAARVANGYYSFAEFFADYLQTGSVQSGNGTFDVEPPMLNFSSTIGDAGQFYGPVPAMILLHGKHHQRRNITPYNKAFKGGTRYIVNNFTNAQDKYVVPMQSGSLHNMHLSHMALFNLPAFTAVNRLHMRCNVSITTGTLNVRFGCMTSPPNYPNAAKEIYWASGTINSTSASMQTFNGSVPIARWETVDKTVHNSTILFVAISGSLPSTEFFINSLSAFPYHLTSSTGLDFQQ